MKHHRLLKRIILCACLAVLLWAQVFSSAFALDPSTLYNGCTGEAVRKMQQALIDLGYLKGTADGIFGNNTENAVRAFQKKNKLDVDGLAGKKTLELIMNQAAGKAQPTPTPAPATAAPAKPTPAPAPSETSQPSSGSSLFGGSYATIRFGQRGARVRALQQALISTGFLSGSADGIFGSITFGAVKAFQRNKKLAVDGIAGKQTLGALEKACGGGSSSPTAAPAATPAPTAAPAPTATPDPGADEINPPISGPSLSSLSLLHWFNDVKPSLSSGQHLLIYDPASGLSWTLRVLARGRHCDAEPLTITDTRTMVKAFGGVHTWNQKAVCVKLPDGRWTIGSTHDMPHQSGTIKDNGFNGHLCVHFLRDMDEAKKNDPKYGVANQETIRTYWKKWTGQEITD